MKITESIPICGYTSLSLSETLPLTRWNTLIIDGIEYEPVPIMDGGNDCIAIHGNHDLTGREIEFV